MRRLDNSMGGGGFFGDNNGGVGWGIKKCPDCKAIYSRGVEHTCSEEVLLHQESQAGQMQLERYLKDSNEAKFFEWLAQRDHL